MPAMYQAFNKRTGTWVKYKLYKGGKTKILNVKQSSPKTPFKDVSIRGKKP